MNYEQQSLPIGDAVAEKRCKRKDPCWEALVRATNENPAAAKSIDRGRFNFALKAIRVAAEREGFADDDALADEIPRRAQAYRERFPTMTLTPTALASHWYRVMTQPLVGMTKQQQAIERARHRP